MRYLITDLSIDGNPASKTGIINLECVKESYAQKIESAKPLDDVPPPEDTD